jgi:hypothetical protein
MFRVEHMVAVVEQQNLLAYGEENTSLSLEDGLVDMWILFILKQIEAEHSDGAVVAAKDLLNSLEQGVHLFKGYGDDLGFILMRLE